MLKENLASYLVGDGRLNLRKYYFFLESAVGANADLEMQKYPLNYHFRNYEFLRICSANNEQFSKRLMVRALVHGNEIWGGLFFVAHLNDLASYAHQRGVGLDLEPCANPYGADLGSRYNPEEGGKRFGNNDFVRYKKSDGTIVDDLKDGMKFSEWTWGKGQPKETRLAYKLLRQRERQGIFTERVAVLDLHGHHYTDPWDPEKAVSYQYLFEPAARYSKIIRKVEKIIPLWKNKRITAGLDGAASTDQTGSVYRHDGSWTAATYLMGAKDSIAVEVSEQTSLETAANVYWIWAQGLIDLIS